MKKLFCSLMVGFSLFAAVAAGEISVPQHLQDISVTIRAGSSSGSGVLFTRKDAEGKTVNFIWTAGHVVDGLRRQRVAIAPDGTERTVVEFSDANIVKEIIEDGRIVGRLELDAEVIRYSDSEDGEDLALLRIRKQNYVESTTKFYSGEIPDVGTQLYHVGSLLGQMGANSMTSGIYSQHGRLIGKTVYDQTTVAAFPGSSGGGVFTTDGKYVGMIVRGSGETFNLIVPIRRIRAWAKRAKVEWAIDSGFPMPKEDELQRLPVEDAAGIFGLLRNASPAK
jgi:S1-C subfamily serine protease